MMMTMIVVDHAAVVSRVRVERDVVRCHVTQWLSNCVVQCPVWGQWLYRSMWALPIIIVDCYLCYCCCCCYYDYHSSLQSAVVGVWLWWWTWCEWMLARIDSGWMIEHSPPCLCVSTQDDDDVIIHIWWLCMMMNDDEWVHHCPREHMKNNQSLALLWLKVSHPSDDIYRVRVMCGVCGHDIIISSLMYVPMHSMVQISLSSSICFCGLEQSINSSITTMTIIIAPVQLVVSTSRCLFSFWRFHELVVIFPRMAERRRQDQLADFSVNCKSAMWPHHLLPTYYSCRLSLFQNFSIKLLT